MSATFVYDDDCGFCSWWAELFAERTDLGIVGFTELTDAEQERLPENWEDCAHLLTEEAVYSCGAAIERALLRTDVLPPVAAEAVAFLRGFEDYEHLRERAYRAGANRRSTLGDFVSADPPARREPGVPDESGETDTVGASGECSAADDGCGKEGASSDSGATDEAGN